MHALIRQDNGKYYVSTVFGYYKDVKSKDDYQRYLESIHSAYYVVWDESETRLIKWFAMQPNTKYLIPQLIIIDSAQKGWIVDEEGVGGVDFLPRDIADQLIDMGKIPTEIMKQCKALDASFVYNPYPEVKTEKDAQDLNWASGGFHDGYIKEE